MRSSSNWKRITKYCIAGAVGSAVGYTVVNTIIDDLTSKRRIGNVFAMMSHQERPSGKLPNRQEMLKALQSGEEFDVLVIGGGATGAGVALDAQTRGLKTALVELDDFASGTSSRSTKLIHGGVRYLQKAIMKADIEQYKMVKEALFERANLLAIAPHLATPLPIMLPVYKWWMVPYFWAGIKMYDLVAGSKCLRRSYVLSKQGALEQFPMLKRERLCGALVYYDGQHNDARMSLVIALTAAAHGAKVLNHCGAHSLTKGRDLDGNLVVTGARVTDELTGASWNIKAKCVINATGPFTDSIRVMDDSKCRSICQPSCGVHIVLPDYYSPTTMGLLDPATSDGRVIFFLPWEGVTIAGTTDRSCAVTQSPKPTEDDIQFILNEIKRYLSPDIEVRRGDVLAAWAGIRPLVIDPNKANTESIARNHVIFVSPSNLVTIAGGKWTTYRSMAEETVDTAVKVCKLKPQRESQTAGLLLLGAHRFSPTMFIRLVQDFGLEVPVAQYLAHTYGDRAFKVAKMASVTGKKWPLVGKRLSPQYPYTEAEIRYACRREYACTAVDMIARRTRIGFVNVRAALESLPKVVEIMAKELNWTKAQQEVQTADAIKFLNEQMGGQSAQSLQDTLEVNLSKEEVDQYVARFHLLDSEKKGFITVNDLRRSFEKYGDNVSEEDLHNILREVDANNNGEVDLSEYLHVVSGIKSGVISNVRLAILADRVYEESVIPVERSGGGL